MSRRERDTYSATSSTSKMSVADRRNSKPPRFSLRRFFCRRPSARSVMSTKSTFDVESRSVASFHVAHEKESQSQHNISTEEASHNSNNSVSQSMRRTRSRDYIECPLCVQHLQKDHFPAIMTCHHRSCRECLRQYLKIEITESRVNIACPECAERFHPNDIRMILEDEALMGKYWEFMIRRVLVTDPDTRWCPAPDCGYAVIAAGCASCPKLKCERPGCDTYFCYHCKQHWHPNQTCDAARSRRSINLRSSSLSYSHDSGSNRDDIKPCPRCGAFIVKMDDGSCNHMTCAVCGVDFCWLCMKEISDLHYLSPSGCTFWGKKPWSRKKKILWQLGTLVGAPVGIALVAGIAVPAMIIGIPVWVGRKLYTKYEHSPRHRRNLIIVGGVTAALLISPVLAALAVGIGVPILLAYVYGVVPISLCRAGGCGVTTTDSGGVRFEFDDETDVAAAASGPYSGEAANPEHAAHVLNPSIGPSIGEMSMGMTNSLSASGSHMDRIGIIHEDQADRESASHRAIASESLTGSLSGSTLGTNHRVEMLSNQSTGNKRSSLSSESANLSLDAKSATISFGDNASTKALAGSICTRDKDNNSAIMPPIDTAPSDVNSSQGYPNPTVVSEVPQPEVQAVKAPTHVTCRQGSPTSGRSVSFLCDETNESSNSARKKKFKLQSVSVGDCIHEQGSAETSSTRGHMSIRSLNTDVATSHMDLTPPNAKAPPISPSQIKGHFNLQPTLSENSSLAGVCLVKSRCYSTDSCPSHNSSLDEAGSSPGLPQVESDRVGVIGMDRYRQDLTKGGIVTYGRVAARQSNCGDTVTFNTSDVVGKRKNLSSKSNSVYFRSNDYGDVSTTEASVRTSIASSIGSQEPLSCLVTKGSVSSVTSGGGLSNRSTSSSDNSTCGLLKKTPEQNL